MSGEYWREIPDGTPIHDGCAWFIVTGASDMFEVRGYKIHEGRVDLNEWHPWRTGWRDRSTVDRLMACLAAGKSIELLC